MKNKIIIISILILIYACKNKQVTEEISEPTLNENTVGLSTAQLKNANIESNLLEQKEIASTIKINGKIDVPPQNIISISAPMGGYLKSTNLLPGMYIKKGELIATLEDQQFIQLQQDYLLAKSKLHFAEVEYNRQKELNQSQATSDKITQQSLAEVNIQRIMMNATAEKLKLIRIDPEKITENNISKNVNIYSPINGYVSLQ
jgi:cobalt-zinc-cadmium efflux system membrane fusion protein